MEQKKITILIADDNKNFCEIMEEHFKKYSDMQIIYIANDGITAYEKIKELKPDVAIVDGIMPRLDGLGILEKLDKNNNSDAPIFIMLSAMSQEKITQKAIDLGAEYYIVKPFDIDSIATRIRQLKAQMVSKSNNINSNNISVN